MGLAVDLAVGHEEGFTIAVGNKVGLYVGLPVGSRVGSSDAYEDGVEVGSGVLMMEAEQTWRV